MQVIGEELAIRWADGSEGYVRLETLRGCCPCAGCKGETDIMGNVYKGPDKPLSAQSYQLTRIGNVGGYAVQPYWADGHNTGIFAYDFLKKVTELEVE